MSCLFFPGRDCSQNFQMSSIMVLSCSSCCSSTQTECPPQWWLRDWVRGLTSGSVEARLCLRASILASAFAYVLW